VADGEIIVLGGLLDDNERRTIEKVPLLGDIPLIGELFRSRGKSRVKTNLMVFIRPTILRSRDDARNFSSNRYDYIRERQLLRNPDVEPAIDALVRDYMGARPPVATGRPDDVLIQPVSELPAAPPATIIESQELPPSEVSP
jgi:general secretion pathway protein D